MRASPSSPSWYRRVPLVLHTPHGQPVTPRRFMDLDAVAGELGVRRPTAYALVRRGELPAIRIGGRGQWRVERAALEKFIHDAYAAARSDLNENEG